MFGSELCLSLLAYLLADEGKLVEDRIAHVCIMSPKSFLRSVGVCYWSLGYVVWRSEAADVYVSMGLNDDYLKGSIEIVNGVEAKLAGTLEDTGG